MPFPDYSRTHPWLAPARLEALGPQRRGIFALACGERLVRVFHECAELSGEVEPDLLRRALDEGWAVLLGGESTGLGARSHDLLELLPSPQADPGQGSLMGGEIGDGLITVACALDAVDSSAAAAMVYAVERVLVMVHAFIARRDGRSPPRQFGRTGPVLDELYGAEARFQEQRLQELAEMPAPFPLDLIRRLRGRYEREAFALETLLLSEPDPPRVSLRLDADPYGFASLEPDLAALTPQRRAAFAALCTARMAPLYRFIAGQLLPAAAGVLDEALQCLWQRLMDEPGSAEALAAHEAALSAALAEPALAGPEGRHARAALEAGRATIRTFSSDTTAEACRACAQPYGVLSDYIVAYHRVDQARADAWKLILRHPVYRAERSRQRGDMSTFRRGASLPTAFFRDHFGPPKRREALPIHFPAPPHAPEPTPASHGDDCL